MPDMIRIPASQDELAPPSQQDLNTQAANFLRAYWDEYAPRYRIIAGEDQSLHGAREIDEVEMVLDIKKKAGENGYSALAMPPTVKLKKALRVGFRRNTGIRFKELVQQNKRLTREHRLSSR